MCAAGFGSCSMRGLQYCLRADKNLSKRVGKKLKTNRKHSIRAALGCPLVPMAIGSAAI